MAQQPVRVELPEPHKGEVQQPAEIKKPNIFVRAWRGYENGLGAFVGMLARASGRSGAFTATHPGWVLLVTLLLGGIICAGWVRFRIETDADVLWVPQHGKAQDDKAYVQANYPQSKDGASFYAQLAPSRYAEFGGNNAVQMPVTWEMFKLHEKILALSVKNEVTGQQVTFADLCYRNQDGTCNNANGYLWYWYKNFTYYVEAIQGSATDPMAGNLTAFKDQVSKVVYPDGQPVSLLSVFGGTTFSFNPFQLQSAEVIASDYTLDYSVDDDTAKNWHLAFIDLLLAELPKQQYMTYTFITGSSVGEELGKSINNDMFLVIISILVFIVIALVFLSQFNIVKTRTSLAVAGVFVTALGIITGWGWGMLFGMPFTPLQQLSPFILLGMGIDVLFILVKSLDIILQREPWLTLPEVFSKLMSTAGLSVQVTLFASSVAFALGAVDELPSVRWFSAFASLNTLMILAFMMTTFIAFMVYTERRIAASRWDILCCVRRKPAPGAVEPAPSGGAQQAWPPQAPSVSRVGEAIKDDDIKEEAVVKKFFRKYYAPFLTKWYVKAVVIAIFLGWAVASWYGIYQVEYGQPLSDLAPDGSYLQDYDKVQEATYRYQVGEPVGLYFRDIDPSSPATQYEMLQAWDMALRDEFINSSTTAFLGNWLVSFISWAEERNATVALAENNCYNPLVGKITGNLVSVITPVVISSCVPQPTFYPLLNQWYAATGGDDNIVRDGPSGPIRTSKFNIMQIASAGDDKYSTHLMDSIRELEDQISSQVFAVEDAAAGEYVSFVYGGSYVFNEGDQILPNQSLIYFMLALVGVFVVTTFMLVNPGASLLMVIAVGLVILYLFGELWVLNIAFNQVSVINMIMATGLSVDYAVYFAQKFMTVAADGTGNGRMVQALTDTGFAVFLGGFTALCGTVPMAFSQSVIIRTFFQLIFGTILFSLAVGLVLMPVLFSLIPLPPVKSALVDGGSNTAVAASRQSYSSDTDSQSSHGKQPQESGAAAV